MDDSRAISTSMVGTDAWVAPHGDLDLANIAEFELALANAATRSHRYVFVELANVTFIDAAGIGALVRAATALDAQGRRMKLLGASGHVQHVLDITGMSAYFGLEADLLGHPQSTEPESIGGAA